VSTNFIIFGPTDQKLWMFEVFGQGLAEAGMCWSHLARVDYLRKKWRSKEKRKKKKKDCLHPVQASTCGRRPTAGRRLALERRLGIGDHWSQGSRRPAVGAWLPGRDQAPTTGRRFSDH
jgi:hypothetical protein